MTPREVFLAYSEALDRGDLTAMDALVHEKFRLEGAGLDGTGKPEFMAAMRAQMAAFPDYSENPTDVKENGNRVSFVAHVTGTQKNALALPGMKPIAATSRKIHLPRSRHGWKFSMESSGVITWRRLRAAGLAEF